MGLIANRSAHWLCACYLFLLIMYFDKIYVLRTDVSLKVSTAALQELIAKIVDAQSDELDNIRSTSDLYAYLSIVVYDGAEALIGRRQRWVDKKTKANLIAGRPIPFHSFNSLFWRNLDEDDPDGDEWQKLIASDEFYSQLTVLLNKVRVIARSLQHQNESLLQLPLGACRT